MRSVGLAMRGCTHTGCWLRPQWTEKRSFITVCPFSSSRQGVRELCTFSHCKLKALSSYQHLYFCTGKCLPRARPQTTHQNPALSLCSMCGGAGTCPAVAVPANPPWQPITSPRHTPLPHTATNISPSCKSFPLLISKPRATFVRSFST